MTAELEERRPDRHPEDVFWRRPRQLLVAACLSLAELRSAECRVYCIGKGYEWGYYAEARCQCVESVPYERIHEKRILLPKRGPRTPEHSD